MRLDKLSISRDVSTRKMLKIFLKKSPLVLLDCVLHALQADVIASLLYSSFPNRTSAAKTCYNCTL